MIRVSAGIVYREGRILICRRGEGRNNAHLWEFPGGKQESGETPEACLARELQEELSLKVSGVKHLCQRQEGDILFDFLTAETDADPVLTEHEDAAFVLPREMLNYDFCPADTAVAHAIALADPAVDTFLWDLDGTLMDTYPPMVAAFEKAAARWGVKANPVRVLALMKVRLGHCCRVFGEEIGVSQEEMLRAFREEEARLDPGKIAPMPGIAEALRVLKERGCRHFVVTHRSKVTAWPYLAAAGLKELFDGGVFPEDGLPSKPAPDMVAYLLHGHGLDAARCLMVGDRPLDIQCGHAAGVDGCLIDPEGRFAAEVPHLRQGGALMVLRDAGGLAALFTPGGP